MGAAAATAMDDSGWATQFESMSAFDSQYGNRSGYVKPIIDNLGNVLNSNWYASASVPQSFTFEAGLPISIIPIGDDDKSYDGKPTIFGDHGNPEAPSDTIYGIKTLNGLGVFTYPYLQMGASFYHFRAVLRMMYLPSISDLRKFSLFGIGFQYSFGHFFQYMLPKAAQPFDVSIVYGYNSSSIGYRPDEFDGKLGLDVSTHNFSFVFGYKPVNFFEVMMSLGYQSAEMLSYGELYQIDPYTNFRKNEIYPDITVKGNNGFRFGLEVAFQLGKTYHPVVGLDYAGKSSFTLNALYLRQQFGEDKTPDEIAKEKGYVRGAKQEEAQAAEPVTEPASENSAEENQTEDVSDEEATEESVEEAPTTPEIEEPATEETSTDDSFNEE
jgi:hypothetical protein